MAHLASLGLPLAGRRTLEIGAGIGRLTGFFERLGCEIVCFEARAERGDSPPRRPERHLVVADIERPGAHDGLGRFETVFCYGVLYHLSDPAVAIAEMAGLCDGLLLLETCVNPADNGEVNPVTEPSHVPDQSLVGRGCRPGRDWIFTELRRHFAHVYAPVTQPAPLRSFPPECRRNSRTPRTCRARFHRLARTA
jgi:SAM-dependent methyltransferase